MVNEIGSFALSRTLAVHFPSHDAGKTKCLVVCTSRFVFCPCGNGSQTPFTRRQQKFCLLDEELHKHRYLNLFSSTHTSFQSRSQFGLYLSILCPSNRKSYQSLFFQLLPSPSPPHQPFLTRSAACRSFPIRHYKRKNIHQPLS